MPLQCSTQWDGLGHIFDHGQAWNGRDAARTVTAEGDLVTGIETGCPGSRPRCPARRGPRASAMPGGELPDGFAITAAHLTAMPPGRHGVAVERGDLVLVRTGQLRAGPRDGLGRLRRRGLPGTVVHHRRLAAPTPRSPAIATDTWGFEVRPNEFDDAFQPLHQVAIPHIGLFIGEMWDLEALAADCAADGRVRVPAHRRAAARHRRGRFPRQPHRRQVTPGGIHASSTQRPRGRRGAWPARPAAICSPPAASPSTSSRSSPTVTALGSGITLQGNALRVLRQLGVWDEVRRSRATPSTASGLRAPDPAGTLLVEMPDARTGGPDLPATLGMPRPALARILIDRAAAAGAKIRFGTTYTDLRQDAGGVDVTFSDGCAGRYDLVVGGGRHPVPDAPHARHRAEIRPTGMGIWRAFGPRPASVTRTDLYYGGPAYIAGVLPHGRGLAVRLRRRGRAGPRHPDRRASSWRRCASSPAPYHGPWDDIRAEPDRPGHGQLHLVRDARGPARRGTGAASC